MDGGGLKKAGRQSPGNSRAQSPGNSRHKEESCASGELLQAAFYNYFQEFFRRNYGYLGKRNTAQYLKMRVICHYKISATCNGAVYEFVVIWIMGD